MIAPFLTLDQRRRDLAEQSFHDAREFDLASRAWLHERRLLVEQASLAMLAMLAMFGFARHFGLPPVLIRAGESLGAHRPPCASSARCGVENAAGRWS